MLKAPLDESKIDDADADQDEPDVRVNFPIPASVHAALRVEAIRRKTTLRGLLVAKLSEFAELERIRGIS